MKIVHAYISEKWAQNNSNMCSLFQTKTHLMRNNKTSNSLTAFICVVSTSTNAATITNIITIAADDAYQASKLPSEHACEMLWTIRQQKWNKITWICLSLWANRLSANGVCNYVGVSEWVSVCTAQAIHNWIFN